MPRGKGWAAVINAAADTASAVISLRGSYDTLTLQIIGTAANSARTITFEESIDGTNYVAAMGLLKTDMATLATGTTNKAEVWTFSVTDVARFRVALTAITGGTVTVFASYTSEG